VGRTSQDVVVRFVGDTGNLTQGMDGLQGRFKAVTGSLEGIAKVGAAVGALSFFKTAIDEAREAARVTRQTEQVIRSTGGAANVTADHIAELSGRLSELAGVDDEVIQHGANLLLTFTRVRNEMGAGNDIFDQATQASLDMSAAMSKSGDAGEGLQETAIRIGKALNDPVKGMTALAKVGVTFTAAQKEQVKALVESGDVLGAQKIVLAELKTEFGGMAEATADSTAKAQVGFKNFAEEIGTRLLPAVNAVSDWAATSGIPTLTKVADTSLNVVIPAVKGLVDAGKGLIGFFSGLPGPVQAAVVALIAWKIMGDSVTSGLGRMTGPLKGFGSDVQTVMTASSGEVGRFGASMQVMQDRIPTIGAMGAAFRTAKGDAESFGGTLRGSVAAGFAGLRGAAGGLVSFLGGPWGIAIAAVTLGLGLFIAQNQKAEARQRDLADAGKRVAQALREQNGLINESVRQVAAKEAEDKGLLRIAQGLGVELSTVTDALLGQGTAYDVLRGKLLDQIAAHTRYQEVAGGGGKGNQSRQTIAIIDAEGKAYQGQLDTLNRVLVGKNDELSAQQRVDQAARDAAATQQGLTAAQDASTTSSGMLKDAVEALGGKFDETKTDGQHLADVIKGLTDAQTTAIDLSESYEQALDNLTASIKDNGTTLDIHSEKGRNNRDALEAAAKSIRDMTLADIESGVPALEAIARHDARVRSLQEESKKLFGTKQDTEGLIGAYSRIPPEVRTIISTQNAEATYQKLLDMNLAQQALAQGITIRAAKGLFGNEAHGGLASGGYVSGPGGRTSDSVPAWLSNGEFVQRADAVDYYGVDVMHALNRRMIPKGRFVPQLAGGGFVNWPFNVETAKTKIPSFGASIPASAVGAGVQRWSVFVLQALKMLGQPASLLPNVLRRMNQESGGNPNAINLTDINAQRGDPSRGLMQTIGSTFAAYAGPFAGRGIYDPFANIYAGLNYAAHRYGNLQYAMDKPGGYRNGGWLMPGGLAYNETSKPEAVFNKQQLAEMGDRHYHFNFNGAVITGERDLENMIARTLDRLKSKGRM